ncbi:MAG: DUF4911 domain-containing protein [Clostridia bacterium]|nr:DUF4911 domain-containing protein [Clostridia bacterium]
MGGRYHGGGNISRIYPEGDPAALYIQVKVEPSKINMFLRLMDGFTHLAFITTVKPAEGLMGIHTTRDTHQEVLEILYNLPNDNINLKIY